MSVDKSNNMVCVGGGEDQSQIVVETRVRKVLVYGSRQCQCLSPRRKATEFANICAYVMETRTTSSSSNVQTGFFKTLIQPQKRDEVPFLSLTHSTSSHVVSLIIQLIFPEPQSTPRYSSSSDEKRLARASECTTDVNELFTAGSRSHQFTRSRC